MNVVMLTVETVPSPVSRARREGAPMAFSGVARALALREQSVRSGDEKCIVKFLYENFGYLKPVRVSIKKIWVCTSDREVVRRFHIARDRKQRL